MKVKSKLAVMVVTTFVLSFMTMTTYAMDTAQSAENQDFAQFFGGGGTLEDSNSKDEVNETTVQDREDISEPDGSQSDGSEVNYPKSDNLIREDTIDDADSDSGVYGDFKYEIKDLQNVKITEFTGKASGALVIPDSIGGIDVTEIGDYVFKGKGFAGELTLPARLKIIGDKAFQDCTGFNGTLVIPDTVEKIGWDAFNGCTGFTGLELPDTLDSLNSGAFYNCSGMKGNLKIPVVAEFGEDVFKGCYGITSLSFAPGVSKLGKGTFSDCYGLSDPLVLPDTFNVVSEGAFSGCTGIPSIKMGKGVSKIEWGAFAGCTGLKSIEWSPRVSKIDGYAFDGCTGLTGELNLPESLTEIGERAFRRCKELSGTLVIPSKVSKIDDSAFYECISVTGLSLPESLSYLGESVFSSCSSVTGEVKIPAAVSELKYYTFSGFGNNVTLVLSEGLEKMEGGVFMNSGLVGKLTIPGTLTEISWNAFNGCKGLTSLEIKPGVQKIGSEPYGDSFSGCTGLTGTLVIPDTVTEIAEYSFCGCVGLTGLQLSNNLTTIHSGAFSGCSKMKGDLNIPDSVTSIGGSAFKDCSGFDGILTIPERAGFTGSTFEGLYNISRIENRSDSTISANCFIKYDDSTGYFVKAGSGEKIIRDGTIGTGTFVRGISIGTPSISRFKVSGSTVNITCRSVAGATGYVFQRSVNGGDWIDVGNYSSTSYTDNKANKNGSKYEYRVYAYKTSGDITFKSDTSNIKTAYFLSKPGKPTLKETTAKKDKKNKKLTVKWKKNSKGTGYQIQLATDKKFTKNVISFTITKNKTLSKEIKNLKKRKTYYVRLRARKKVDGKTWYSAWSSYSKKKMSK